MDNCKLKVKMVIDTINDIIKLGNPQFGKLPLRKDEIIIPRSNYVFKKEDVIVFLAKRDQLTVVENMFRISSI